MQEIEALWQAKMQALRLVWTVLVFGFGSYRSLPHLICHRDPSGSVIVVPSADGQSPDGVGLAELVEVDVDVVDDVVVVEVVVEVVAVVVVGYILELLDEEVKSVAVLVIMLELLPSPSAQALAITLEFPVRMN